VSVVVPTYNSTRHLAETIAGVRAQTMTDWELVLFDDGSTDGTVELGRSVAADDPRVRVVAGERAGGVAAARNRGFEATDERSEFVIFLDHDDVWEPDLLATLIDALEDRPDLVAAHGLARCIDGASMPVVDDGLEAWLRDRRGYDGSQIVARSPDKPTRFADLIHANWVVTPGLLLVRRDARLAVGGFDPKAVPSDDWDMSVRLSRLGDFGYVDEVVLLWRRIADAQSFQSRRWVQSHFHVRRRTIWERTNTREQFALARHAVADMHREARHDTVDGVRRGEIRGAARDAVIVAWSTALRAEGLAASAVRTFRRLRS
jgi:glycosyltransferase involved in cell wall biosynthesis